MFEGTSIVKHVNEFNLTMSQLDSVKISFEDEVRALILLSSLWPRGRKVIERTFCN